MADQSHVDLLLSGVDQWNAARPDSPDLGGADLSNANLRGADLSRAILERTHLNEADLRDADLSHAGLREAKLAGADLRAADLGGADLRKADLLLASLEKAFLDEADLGGALLIGASLHLAELSRANLHDANLCEADLSGAKLRKVDLGGANLRDVKMPDADLSGANGRGAILYRAILQGADLSGADLSGADLHEANLRDATLRNANLSGAKLSGSQMVRTDIEGAMLTSAKVYGVAAWELRGSPADQRGLVVTRSGDRDGAITVDDLRLAQFASLLLPSEEVRDVVDTITAKVVLILGSFSAERMSVLELVRDEVRRRDRLPVIFNFAKPRRRGYGETVRLLAAMSRYLIVDITDAKEVRSELSQVVPQFPRIPVQPILAAGHDEYDTFATDVRPYPWVLEIYRYQTPQDLLDTLTVNVIEPVEQCWRELHRQP